MFDVSFTELMVIGVIALIVIGPERLPKVARTVGHLLGRAQRYVSDVKGDIKREIELDELRKFKTEMEDAAQTVNTSLRETEASIRKSSSDLRSELDATARDAASAVKGDGTTAPDALSNNATPTSVATPDPLGSEPAKAPVAASSGNPVAPEPANPAPAPAQNSAGPHMPAPAPSEAAAAPAPSVSPTAAMPPIDAPAHDTAPAKPVETGPASDAKAPSTRGAAS